MTKFILHGGETGVPNSNNKAFYQEWVKDIDSDKVPTILLVYYSRPDEIWDDLLASDKERFAKYTNNRPAKFIVASNDMDEFKKQIIEADVLYFRGGEPQKIIDTLKSIKDEFISLIDGKVFAGSSAGVMFLSEYSRSRGRDWQKWLGLLPINSIVHYTDEKHKESLDNFKKNNPDNTNDYILLPETEFIVKTY
ncbi:Type 1 glutamine amidotransferase-like domain-containing protein [Patescibacteria group bacterium]|nr:Type 1 glutamine amidotransferase-like domain-containing protein [Patescibacteria group bacterium]